jgi:sugar/nucleoside kinase (ribokinase family)
MEPLDFLAIGDIVTEPFIRLKEAEVFTKEDGSVRLSISWGDKIPYEFEIPLPAVGNAANASVSAARLGLSSGLNAYVGKDSLGDECLEVLKKEHVNTDYMVQEAGKETNHHFVLWYESDRTILVKHTEFDYQTPELSASPKWIYLSSLSEHSLPFHLKLEEFLAKHPDSRLTFQPGTFQMNMGVEPIKALYERTELFVVNKEEAERILKLTPHEEIPTLLKGLKELGPNIISITDGTKGAYAYDGNEMLFVPMYPDQKPPYERTGAGDAYASSVSAALALGLPLREALLWGPINSMSVVQQVGAQRGLLTREELSGFLANAPESYKISSL